MAVPQSHLLGAAQAGWQRLNVDIARLCGRAEAQVADAVQVVAGRDVALAHAVVARDAGIDALQRAVEANAVALLSGGQPLALDVRRAVGAVKLATALERVGDLCRNIAKRGLVLAEHEPLPGPARSAARMGGLVAGRMREVLDAYVARDLDRAMSVWRRDAEIDEHYNSAVRELLTTMAAAPAAVPAGAQLLLVVKNLERIGDHATGVAELAHFEISGTEPPTPRPMALYAL